MSKRIKVVVGMGVGVVVLAVVAVVLLILARDDPPEAVDLESAVARLTAESNGDDPAASASSSDETGVTPSADRDAPATGDGETDAADDTGAEPAAAGDGGTATAGTAAGNDSDSNATDAGAAANTGATEPVEAGGDGETGTASSNEAAGSAGGLAGVWVVEVAGGAVDLLGEPAVSFAGFRVDEVLGGGIGDFTAVGRTADVSGSIELTGTALVAATVEVQMATLRTDNGSRDGRIRQALNTSEFPLAAFTLTEPVELPAGAAAGEPFSGSTVGDLTIKGVTNRVSFDLEAQLVDDKIVAVGSSEVVFSDYGITAPSAPIVVSVEDQGIMEFQLIFTSS